MCRKNKNKVIQDIKITFKRKRHEKNIYIGGDTRQIQKRQVREFTWKYIGTQYAQMLGSTLNSAYP